MHILQQSDLGLERDAAAEGGGGQLVLLTRHGGATVREPGAHLQRVHRQRRREVRQALLELKHTQHPCAVLHVHVHVHVMLCSLV